VPKADLRQYASRFATSSGSPYCVVVKRSAESSVERLRRQDREPTRDLRAELVTAKGAIASARGQKQPALTASFLAAVLLAIAARYLGLTDEDLAILGPVMLIVASIVIRAGVFAPDTVKRLLGEDGGP
jgi:hypothetical protein